MNGLGSFSALTKPVLYPFGFESGLSVSSVIRTEDFQTASALGRLPRISQNQPKTRIILLPHSLQSYFQHIE